jgi:uncharacterized protein YacL (UPF0231 family)
MDIIIKSQRGDLYKVDYVIKHKASIVIMPLGMSQKIGEYTTEERAKEVMAEIEEHIREKYAMEQGNIYYDGSSPDCGAMCGAEQQLAIFDMPAE